MYKFDIAKTYSFSTLAPAILGTRINNATLVGIVDYRTALTMLNVDLIHRQVFPLLPAGTVNNTKNYIYYVFSAEGGAPFVMASVWIEEATIEIVENITISISVPHTTLSDVQRIRDTLNLMGYTGFTIASATSPV